MSKKATEFLEAFPHQGSYGGCGLYVIAPAATRSPCKIGVAEDFNRRLSGLQVSHYEELSIAQQFWLDSRPEAVRVEKAVHKLLKPKRIRGEWFKIPASEANLAVLRVLEDFGYKNLECFWQLTCEHELLSEIEEATGLL